MRNFAAYRNDMSNNSAFASSANAADTAMSYFAKSNIAIIADAIIMASVILFALIIVCSVITVISVAILIAVVVLIIAAAIELIIVFEKMPERKRFR